MSLVGSSDLSPRTPHTKIFRAGDYWERNLRGLPMAATAISTFLVVLGGILLTLTGTVPWVSALLILTGIGVPLALFPGKMAALYPYAVEVLEGKGLRFFSALGEVYLPFTEVKGVRRSFLYGGWLISFKKRHGLLRGYLIHFTWGRQGHELSQEIREELARTA